MDEFKNVSADNAETEKTIVSNSHTAQNPSNDYKIYDEYMDDDYMYDELYYDSMCVSCQHWIGGVCNTEQGVYNFEPY